jgi:hypothetical protein
LKELKRGYQFLKSELKNPQQETNFIEKMTDFSDEISPVLGQLEKDFQG